MTLVLDTSALLFWTLDPERLSARAREAIARAEKLVVSAISVWEIGIKVKWGKLQIPLPIAEYADGLTRLDRVEIVAVDLALWLENLSLDWEHRDRPITRLWPWHISLAARWSLPMRLLLPITRRRSGRRAG